MADFKTFLETTAHQETRKSLARLPAKHRALTRGFAFKFHTGDTLDGDDANIGRVDVTRQKKEITVASPWHYPREFALLHEVGHLVWAKFVKGTPLEKKWMAVYRASKGRVRDNAEECFCHAYSQTYGVNKMKKFAIPSWERFIRALPK